MDAMKLLAKRLQEFLALKGEKTHEEIAGYVVGELIGDYEENYKKLLDSDDDVKRIADLSSDLEWSNGSPKELATMWEELEGLIKKLSSRAL